jgi:hypothetical protein
MDPSFDNECPVCHKRFSNESCVLRHMNHPRSSCTSWFDFLESIPPPPERRPHTPSTNHGENTSDDDMDYDNEAPRTPDPTYYEDLHPNTPFIIGSGPKFTDIFNADCHATKRAENLYYPFSSKAEWGLASWLLCSGLSMRAVDDFLSLPIVSMSHMVHLPANCEPRSSNFHSLLQLRKHYEAGWTNFPRLLHGRCKKSPSAGTRR